MTVSGQPPDAISGEVVTDAVTGAHSRALLEVRLREELARSRRSGADCSLLLFDVDHFKSVNDGFGHVRGDEVLRQVVERVNRLLRDCDAVYRYGGDEFVVVLTAAGKTEAATAAMRLTQAVGHEALPGDPPLRVTVSVGVASFPEDAADATGLIAAADRRSYLAKRRGRDCVVVDDATPGATGALARLLEREAAMTAAHEFLAGLVTRGPGTLRIGGPRGAGHTRFVDEVATVAELRGFEVVHARDEMTTLVEPGSPAGMVGEPPSPVQRTDGSPVGVLVVADGEASWFNAARLARERLGDGTTPTVGLVLAGPGPAVGPADAAIPLRNVVELAPLSAPAIRIWLRTKLGGEPSPALVDWVRAGSAGLPARAERILNRLMNANGIERTPIGWTLAGNPPVRPVQRPLPVPPTELVGRGREIDQVIGLLTAERLVTLVGPGGVGKTRLAVEVATAATDRFDEGAVFVSLTEATTTQHVESAVAQALHVADVPDRPLAETIADHLAGRHILLVLDNFEQVLSAAPRVATWLTAAPRTTVLVTSRERLRLSAERVYPVPGLSLPTLDTVPDRPDALARVMRQSAAVSLFTARARRVAYDFALTPQNMLAVAELCHRLDGLPLAIELAAARVAAMSPQELLSRMSEQLDLLVDGPVDLPDRQQTLRATIGWSYQLLDDTDRALFAALAVFAGGCRLEAVEAVLPADRLAERLAHLVDKSLLQVETDPDGETRFVMLDTIRSFAAEQLAATDAVAEIHARHAAYYATFAERAASQLTGADQPRWMELTSREHHNIRAALSRSLARGDARTAARISAEISSFWVTRSYLSEGREWLARVLDGRDMLPPALLSKVLNAAASMALFQGDVREALLLSEEGLRWARVSDDHAATARALRRLGAIHATAGRYEQARALIAESLALARAEGDRLAVVYALSDLGAAALGEGKLDDARALLSESLDLSRAIGHTSGVLVGLVNLGEIAMFHGDVATARARFDESLALGRELGDVRVEAHILHHLGLLADVEGNRTEARRLLTAALALRQDVRRGRHSVADSLEALAGITIERDPATAARMFGAAEALRDAQELSRPPIWQHQWETHMKLLRETLGDNVRSAAWASGVAASLDEVVAEALALDGGFAARGDR